MPATPIGNGEHKSDADAKASLKAEALAKAAAIAEAQEALKPLAALAEEAANTYIEADTARNEAHLSLGYSLADVEAFLVSSPLDVTIAAWAEENLPEVSAPSFGTSPAYRALQAAKVARSVRGGIGGTSTDALRPMYRVKDVPGATAKVFSAAKAAAGRGKVVRKRHVEEALESLFPKDESATPGPKRGAKASAPKPRNTPTATGPVEVPDHAVSATRLKAALTRMTEVLTAESVSPWEAAAAAVKCSADYGISATAEAVKALVPKAAPKAAKPRTPRKRTPRK